MGQEKEKEKNDKNFDPKVHDPHQMKEVLDGMGKNEGRASPSPKPSDSPSPKPSGS